MFTGEANIFILSCIRYKCFFPGKSGRQYHVERHDILERDVASPVAPYQDIVDDLWAAAGRESEYEGPVRGWLECLDAC